MVGVDQHLSIDGVGSQQQVIFSSDEQFWIAFLSEHKSHACIVYLRVVSVQVQGILDENELLIKVIFRHIVEPALPADDM